MGEDEAHKLWESSIRHDERIEVLENNWAELRLFMDSVTKELGRLSSYNILVASKLQDDIHGNGKPGLKTIVLEQSKELILLKERTEVRKETHDADMIKIGREIKELKLRPERIVGIAAAIAAIAAAIVSWWK